MVSVSVLRGAFKAESEPARRGQHVIPQAQALHRETSSTSQCLKHIHHLREHKHSFLLGEEAEAETRGFFGVVVFPSL